MLLSLKKNLIAGLIILLPIAQTVVLIIFFINLFTDPFVHLVSSLLVEVQINSTGSLWVSSPHLIQWISKMFILVFLFFLTVFLGFMTRWFVGHSFLSYMDKMVKKIPIIRSIYQASQEIIKRIFSEEETSFKQVVMLPFPHKESYALGLIASQTPDLISQEKQDDLISVLIPTTPNPISGFLIMAPKKDLIFLKLKPQEALKYIISMGILPPENKDS